jgi:hypothetical protein
MTVPGPDQGYHDIQRGAAGYSVVVGAFGALAVPAIVLVFTAPPAHVANAQTLEAFATGLLVTGMFGSLLGAIAFAYLAAERDPIAALAPAIVFAAVPVSVSFSSILGAFEVLAVLYQPSAKGLFAITVAAGGLFGVIYSSLAVIHSVTLGPTDEVIRQEWLPRQPIRTQQDAKRAAMVIALVGVLPIVVSVAMRIAEIHVRPTTATVNAVIGIAIALTIVGPLLAVSRTATLPTAAQQKALRPVEIYWTNLVMSGFVLLMLVALP